MAEKRIDSRIINKHATEAVWHSSAHRSFIPFQGEIIVYDIDNTHNFERMKIGDGKTTVELLPFVNNNLLISSTQPSFACTWFNIKS